MTMLRLVQALILEERPLVRVSKDEGCGLSWFETVQEHLLTMRIRPSFP
jgi:hypothetical protein